MPTSLTATKIKDTYGQVLHVDGGVNSTPKLVYDGDGTATALKVSTTDVQVNNSPVLTDVDIGSTVQAYDADLTAWSGKTAPTGTVVGTSDSQALSNKSFGDNPTLNAGTANGVAYLNGSKVLTTGSALTFDGASIQVSSNVISGQSGGADGNFVLKRASDGLTVGALSVNSASSRLELSTAYDPITFSNYLGEQMRLTSTGLGIGTSSPISKLHVNIAGNALSVTTTGNNNNGLCIGVDIDGSGVIASYAGGVAIKFGGGINSGSFTAERMRIDSSGTLLLGRTSADASGNLLQLYATSGSKAGAIFTYGGVGSAAIWENSSNALVFGNDNNNGSTERMRIDSSGNVGIGTSSPQSRLNVYSSTAGQAVITLSDATLGVNYGAQLKGYGVGGTGGFGEFGVIDAGTYSKAILVGQQANYLAFYTGTAPGASSERMRIDSSGNLLVGKTTTDFGTDGVRLEPAGTIAVTIASYTCLDLNRRSDGNIVSFYRSGTSVGNISVTTSNTTYSTSSDYRLKENIQPMQGALGVVAQLNPVTYNWKADGSDGQGFIAHELQAVVPDCVTGEKDAVDKDGKPVYQGIDTSFLIATLTKAIQEQQEQINQLTARVAQLEGN